jgi:large repetitive protein
MIKHLRTTETQDSKHQSLKLKKMIRIILITIFYLISFSLLHSQSCIEITEPTALTITCSKVDVSAVGANDGQASVNVSGGTMPYSYLWSNGATTSTITGLTAGVYNITVTDANGCVNSSCSSQVLSPSCITPDAGADITIACNGNTAFTTAQLAAAASGYSWHLVTQPSTANASINNSGLVAGLTIVGDYTFELRQDTDSACKDALNITVPTCIIPCPTVNCGTISVRKL